MFPQDIIRKKRDGGALSREEIAIFIDGVVDGGFEDYQATALLMAIFLKGMTAQETAWLTTAMMNSGEVIDLSQIDRPKADKHSTGGVGDKVSLILAPLAASAGLCVPMMSGRGLGHTGGTLDKLEAIPGFNVNLDIPEFKRLLSEIGVAMIGQTETLVPADRKLYALRDVTATVSSIPLICASIMSKKMAEGTDSLVLDVKFGSGAFMKTEAAARELAEAMVAIGKEMNRNTVALLTAMNEPLGRKCGNALEVVESIECLQGEGPGDLMEVTLALTAQMMVCGGLSACREDAEAILRGKIESGEALEFFRKMVEAQGGDPRVIDDFSILPTASAIEDICWRGEGGFVSEAHALKIGQALMVLGAGRESVDSVLDLAVGISDLVKVGQAVEAGDVLCRLHVTKPESREPAERLIREAIKVQSAASQPEKLILDFIT